MKREGSFGARVASVTKNSMVLQNAFCKDSESL